VKPRLGQGAFRILVTDIYERKCSITQERTLPALEAAHIRPYSDGGAHEARNGLLLRRDIHSLFDLGYVTVTPELRFEVSRRIREEYDNGRQYYAMHGKQIEFPKMLPCDPTRRRSPGIMTTASRADRFYQTAQIWFERRCRATSLLEIAA
jgi:putative restriction endonuclease